MQYNMQEIREDAAYILDRIAVKPTVAIILGSGLSALTEQMESAVKIPYGEIPHFPKPVHSPGSSHAGVLYGGQLGGKPVVVMSGRYHYYQGYEHAQVAYPVAVFAQMGIQTLIVTNAAGGVNTGYQAGDLMAITDQIKLVNDGPLRACNFPELGARFFDMSRTYAPAYLDQMERIAQEMGFPLRKGVYAYMAGPQFETPAEIRMLRAMGADAVGMSTVDEVIMAAHCGLKVAGVSCITNMAAGVIKDSILSDEEVCEVAATASKRFIGLLTRLIERMI